jgi:antitoxin (DNA-binding transcriptional repressor) of toxin-antitoxin stability system
MQTLSVEEVEGHLGEVIDNLAPGEELVLTRGDQPVATIKATSPRQGPRFGTMKGTITYIAPDFDAIPEGFEDYLP